MQSMVKDIEAKVCSSCKEEKPVTEYYKNKAKREDKIYIYPRGKCKECEKAVKKNWSGRKEYYRRYFSSEKGIEVQKRYRNSKKGQANEARNRERRKLKRLYLVADLPGEIVAPVVEEVLKYNEAKHLAEILGTDTSRIYRSAKGGIKKHSIDFCDKLCMLSITTNLNDLYESAREWAEENPEKNWPLAYDPSKRRKSRKKVGKS